ncbi:Spy/CpxP family protein refolding chaperone [Methylocapsa sp. D3K7]|uniref:Spy/CpxP family protein refolding chaperone n=1 Tax=Methylocapsa sp. D3K7 TaxID=3041435 RepID=UPI00244EBFF1|nr:Spy/CpxP family protein refolding chaperone [Methylocapsa sp. D3K7]WGJ14978.1 Spy/CpxP family protein refolding chaperone [Methylocapsa sp. D3K7]
MITECLVAFQCCWPKLLGLSYYFEALMKKHILIAATAALLVLPSLPATVFAASSETFGNAEGHHPKFSQEDFAAFTDARIAALKAGLKLMPAQEKNWPVLEATLRDQANARAARMAEWHQKTGELSEHRSVIEGLEQGAKRLATRSAEMEKLADAAKPLYDSLDDAQRGRFRILLRMAAGKHWHHGSEGFRHG